MFYSFLSFLCHLGVCEIFCVKKKLHLLPCLVGVLEMSDDNILLRPSVCNYPAVVMQIIIKFLLELKNVLVLRYLDQVLFTYS